MVTSSRFDNTNTFTVATTTTTTTTMTTTTPLIIDFSVAHHTISDKFIVIFTQFEYYVTHETRTTSASCNGTSNVAFKFEEFETTARLVLTGDNDSSIFSKTLKLFECFFLHYQFRHYGELTRQSNPIVQVD